MPPTRLIVASALGSVALTASLGLLHPGHVDWLEGSPAQVYPIAPRVDLVGLDGHGITSADLRGDVLVLEFWATWCSPCIREIDDYNALQADYADRGLKVLGVAMESGSAGRVAAFALEHGIEYPIAMGDDDIVRSFGPLWGYPTTLVIDRNWTVRRAWVGAGDHKMRQLRAQIEAILAEDD